MSPGLVGKSVSSGRCVLRPWHLPDFPVWRRLNDGTDKPLSVWSVSVSLVGKFLGTVDIYLSEGDFESFFVLTRRGKEE